VTHTKSNIVQYNEYYPFGLQTANSWTRENATGNNFLANGGTEFNTTSNLYDLDYRNYDPVLGRMNGVDPMATKYASLTPYNYSFNDPVSFTDPNGADPSGYWEGAEPVFEYYTSWFYNPGYGWLQDDVVYQRIIRWTSVSRYGGPGLDWMFSGAGQGITGSGSWQASTFAGIGFSMSIGSFLNAALNSPNGGSWSGGQGSLFTSQEQALVVGMMYNNYHNSWSNTMYGSAAATEFAYTWTKATGEVPLSGTVNYWLNIREQVLKPQLLASTGTSSYYDNPLLSMLRRTPYFVLRIALHLPDAIAVAGNVNMIGFFGFDLSFPGTTYLKMLTGPDAGLGTPFDEYGKAIGYDASVGASFTELYFWSIVDSPVRITDFSGRRYSLSVGWGGIPIPGLQLLDMSKGFTWATSRDLNNQIRGYAIGINTFIGIGDPGLSFNFNYADTVFRR
jgi:RHS repeat-associated protein